MSSPLCRHCGLKAVNRPKGLCWTCYYRPGVAALYPSTSVFARRGHANGCHQPAPPARPTDAEPGSEDKLAVLESRAARGEGLWHPRDTVYSAPVPWALPRTKHFGVAVEMDKVDGETDPTFTTGGRGDV